MKTLFKLLTPGYRTKALAVLAVIEAAGALWAHLQGADGWQEALQILWGGTSAAALWTLRDAVKRLLVSLEILDPSQVPKRPKM